MNFFVRTVTDESDYAASFCVVETHGQVAQTPLSAAKAIP